MAWWASRGKPPLTAQGLVACAVAGLSPATTWPASWTLPGWQYISASLERLILYLNPTLVLLLGWLLYKRKVRPIQMVAMAVSYAGVLLVFAHEVTLEGANVALGTALVFGSAVSYAIYLTNSGELVPRLGSHPPGGPGHHVWPAFAACCSLCCCGPLSAARGGAGGASGCRC